MKTIEQLIKLHGGFRAVMDHHISIENEPFTRLAIEVIGGPRVDPVTKVPMWKVSVAHYSEQNGDAMRDPEMCFWVSEYPNYAWVWAPVYFRNDYAAVEQMETEVMRSTRLMGELASFSRMWDSNLIHQKFVDAYNRSRLQPQPPNPQPAQPQR